MTDEYISIMFNSDMTIHRVSLPSEKLERWLYVHVYIKEGNNNYWIRRFKIRNLGRFSEINSLLEYKDKSKTYYFGQVYITDAVLYEIYIVKLLIESSIFKQIEKQWKSTIKTPSV